jgi:hypothetical protein
MFSKFIGGVKKTIKDEVIDLSTLVRGIKNNPEKDKILEIRDLRKNNVLDKHGNELFKVEKKKLSIITTNAVVNKRSLKEAGDFEQNFIYPSGFIYFDLDLKDINDTQALKADFIKKYSNKVSLVSYSSSMGGISVFVKYAGVSFSNEKQFEIIRRYIIDTHFSDIYKLVDKKTEGISQIWFIPYDPEVFYNYDNVLDLPKDLFLEYENKNVLGSEKLPKKCKVQYNSVEGGEKILDFTSLPNITDALSTLIFKTKVIVQNRIIDVKEEEFTSVFVPRIIQDGQKRSTYTYIFSSLIKLNPSYIEHIVSFLMYVNQNNTLGNGMSPDVFNKFISGLIKTYNSGKLKYPNKIKKTHINPNAFLSPREKSNLSNRVNGILKKSNSIKLIHETKQQLAENGKDLSKTLVSKITQLSRPTVSKYWDQVPLDIQGIIDEVNESYNIN